jgi:hypothetical protein
MGAWPVEHFHSKLSPCSDDQFILRHFQLLEPIHEVVESDESVVILLSA